ncbi:MAG: non-canonical purine NTP pyrophosphatase [Thermoplasmata archaeon]
MTARPIDVTFVSRNPGKVREIRRVLSPFGVRVRWTRRELPEPQAASLEEVVVAKLAAVRDLPGYVLVEDSGLFIPSLHGFPGVYSAHFLETWGFGPMFELLRTRSRGAYFQTVAGLRKGGKTWTFSGEVPGSIAPRARGKGGFGYDPIFIPRGWDRTFAQGSDDEKNAISHRARATRKVGEFLAHARR